MGRADEDHVNGDEQERLAFLARMIRVLKPAVKAGSGQGGQQTDTSEPSDSEKKWDRPKHLRKALETTITSYPGNYGTLFRVTLPALVDDIVKDANDRLMWWGADEPHNSRAGTEEDKALRLLEETGVVSFETDKDGLIMSAKLTSAAGRAASKLSALGRSIIG
jgi:hypothetical protein